MFRGRYPGTVDAKGRLSIPAKFRDVLARYEGRDLVAVPDGECLEVYPLPEWERMEAKLREQSRFNSEVREISRLYVSRAKDVAMDGDRKSTRLNSSHEWSSYAVFCLTK